MAPLGDTQLVFCLFFIACCYLTGTLAQVPVDCCLSVGTATVPKHAIVDHHRQVAGQGCALNATILVTRRSVRLCLPADQEWVEKIVEHVKQLKKCCSNKAKCKLRRKNKLCIGVKPERIQELKL